MSLFNPTQIEAALTKLKDWKLNNGRMEKIFSFKNFVEAIEFVNTLVAPAESMDHHPDITINYNKVILSLVTHSAGGITEKDFELARKIDAI